MAAVSIRLLHRPAICIQAHAACADHALDEFHRAHDSVHERAAHLQCAFGALLGRLFVLRACPLLQITTRDGTNGERVGVTRVFGREFDTTDCLVCRSSERQPNAHAFPSWITIPGGYSLAMARDWHFFFAWIFVLNGVAYVLYSLFSRHLVRDLAPTGRELRTVGASIVEHAKFKHPSGEAAKRYNVLQKLAYLSVIFVLLPLVILAGWAMSPWLNSIFPGWVDLLGGRQSARTIHFIVAWLLFLFLAVHVFEVIISGFWNHLRSMITGRYRITGVRDAQRQIRRSLLLGAGSAGALFLSGCDRLSQTEWFPKVLRTHETLTRGVHKLLGSRPSMAQEFSEAEYRRFFEQRYVDARRRRLSGVAANGFADWQLEVDGLVERRSSCHWRSCAQCRVARRSRGMTALKAGAQSESGPACLYRMCWPW